MKDEERFSEVRYRVCPHRNDPRAFERFFGEDSGGVQRFFADRAEEDEFFAGSARAAWRPVTSAISTIATDARSFNPIARELSALMLQSLRSGVQLLKLPKPLLSR